MSARRAISAHRCCFDLVPEAGILGPIAPARGQQRIRSVKVCNFRIAVSKRNPDSQQYLASLRIAGSPQPSRQQWGEGAGMFPFPLAEQALG
jgi:hypothetical protein